MRGEIQRHRQRKKTGIGREKGRKKREKIQNEKMGKTTRHEVPTRMSTSTAGVQNAPV